MYVSATSLLNLGLFQPLLTGRLTLQGMEFARENKIKFARKGNSNE